MQLNTVKQKIVLEKNFKLQLNIIEGLCTENSIKKTISKTEIDINNNAENFLRHSHISESSRQKRWVLIS
jgi:hypothetical protein